MRFFTTAICAIAAFAGLSLAVDSTENPIIKPDGSVALVAGETFEITWVPTTSGPITLALRQGGSTNLKTISTLTSGYTNSGSYSWSIPSDLPSGTDYAIMISAGDLNNYTPQFAIKSSFVPTSAAPSVASSSAAAPSAAAASSSAASSSVAVSSAAVSSAPASSEVASSKVPSTLVTATGTRAPVVTPVSPTGNLTHGGNGTVPTSAKPSPTNAMGAAAVGAAANVFGLAAAVAAAMIVLN